MKTIVKCRLNLIAAIIMVGSVIPGAFASFIDSEPQTLKMDKVENWTLVQNENGIAIFFSEFISGGESFLKIKFENTTTDNINFTWSLLRNSERVIITNDEMIEIYTQLSPAGTEEYGATSFIMINTEEFQTEFVVNINQINK